MGGPEATVANPELTYDALTQQAGGQIDACIAPLQQGFKNLTSCTLCGDRYNQESRKALLCPCGWMCCRACMEGKKGGPAICDAGNSRVGATYDVTKCPGCRQRHPNVPKHGFKVMTQLVELVPHVQSVYTCAMGIESSVVMAQKAREVAEAETIYANAGRDEALKAKAAAEAAQAELEQVRNQALSMGCSLSNRLRDPSCLCRYVAVDHLELVA